MPYQHISNCDLLSTNHSISLRAFTMTPLIETNNCKFRASLPQCMSLVGGIPMAKIKYQGEFTRHVNGHGEIVWNSDRFESSDIPFYSHSTPIWSHDTPFLLNKHSTAELNRISVPVRAVLTFWSRKQQSYKCYKMSIIGTRTTQKSCIIRSIPTDFLKVFPAQELSACLGKFHTSYLWNFKRNHCFNWYAIYI